MKIPNPLRLIDDLIIDGCFNPLAWWCKYHYDKDAPTLATFVTNLGFFFYVVVAFKFFPPFMLVVCWMIWFERQNRDQFRRNWIRANKTGRNARRQSDSDVHLRFLLWLFPLSFYLTTPFLLHQILMVVGVICAVNIPIYFGATDSMPPSYSERKNAPKFA